MTPSSDVALRLLTPGDVEEALVLSTTAGWNQRPEDWRMLLGIAPAGAFAAVVDRRIVGTAIGIDYDRFGWIAMMLVEPAYRGRGLGARLLEAAIQALPPSNPIRLDATPLGRPLYQRYGFADESLLTRHVREPGAAASMAAEGRTRDVRPVTKAAMTEIVSTDRDVFGGDRTAVLEWMAEEGPQYGWFAPASQDNPPSYCFGRRGRLFDQIGPVVAGDDDAATMLVSAAAAAAGDRPTVIDAFDARPSFCAWLRRAGFGPQRPLFRMRRPPSQAPRAETTPAQPAVHELAILGPEFA
ncbi:MAG: GNAT family N-acetyltransferase [Vicinamibacterales bacterium]